MGMGMRQMMATQGGPRGTGPGGTTPGAPNAGGPGGPAGGGSMAQMRQAQMQGGAAPNPSDMAGMMAAQRQGMQQQGAGRGGPGGPGERGGTGPMAAAGMPGRGGPGGPGNSAANDKPADFRTPEGAVEAFLAALEAKDPDRLLEASALRASLEPPEKNKALFKKIFELSLSDSELDDLSKNFENYKIAGENPVKSTGRVGVILQKTDEDGNRYTRVVTVRREAKGWGVLHIDKPTEFKTLGQSPRRRTGTGGGR